MDSLCRRELYDAATEKTVKQIIDAVGQRGDKALLEYALKFDQLKLKSASDLRVRSKVSPEQIAPGLRKALREALRNVKQFARAGRPENWSARNLHGAATGEKFFPYDRVGVYIPGGTAPLVSTCLMTVALAKEAGVKEIVVCSPAGSSGKLHPALRRSFPARRKFIRWGGRKRLPRWL